MSKNRFIYTNIVYWLAMSLTGFILENLSVLSNFKGYGFDSFTFYGLLFVTMSMFLTYQFVNRRQNHVKTNWLVFSFLAVFTILGVIAIWSHSSEFSFYSKLRGTTYTLEITNQRKLYYTGQFILFITFLYVTITVFFKAIVRLKSLNWLVISIIIFAYVAIIVSLFIDFKSYELFFDLNAPIEDIPSIKSFFFNENAFGHCLLCGIFACMGINIKRNNALVYTTIFIFYTFLFFTTCAAAIFIATVVVPFYLFMKLGITISRDKAAGVSLIVLYILLACLLTTLLIIGEISDYLPFFSRVCRFNHEFILSKDFFGISGRSNVWNMAVSISSSNTRTLWIGTGFGIFREIFVSVPDFVNSAHNGLLEILGNYGVIGLVFYGLLLTYGMVICLKLITNGHGEQGAVYLIVGLSIVAYGFAESSYFFQNNMSGMIQTVLVFMPPIALWKRIKHPERDMEVLTRDVEEVKDYRPFARVVGYACISAMLLLIMFSLMCFNTPHLKLKCCIIASLCMGACLMFLYPYLIAYKFVNHKGIFFFIFDFIFVPLLKGGVAFFIFFIVKNESRSLELSSFFGAFTFVLLTWIDFQFISKGNIKRREAYLVGMKSLFNKEWIYLSFIFIATVISGFLLKSAMNPDYQQRIVIIFILIAVLINSYYLFFRKQHAEDMKVVSDIFTRYDQKLIREAEI